MDFDKKFDSIDEICSYCEYKGIKMSEFAILKEIRDKETDRETILSGMKEVLTIMKNSVKEGMKKGLKSASGLSGGDAYRMAEYRKSKNISGNVISSAINKAIAVSELNASMGKIVAAPTAGSCGILPAAILSYQEANGCSDEQLISALLTAAIIGDVIAKNATLSGAEGGCQAECGSAQAMAAAALVELAGGGVRMSENAVAIALKNILGLVCDPVCGLVEIPCIKRNAAGVTAAYTAAEMALAGIESHIPADEVIMTMKKIGNSLPSALKETAEGGLAITPTGIKLTERIFGSRRE